MGRDSLMQLHLISHIMQRVTSRRRRNQPSTASNRQEMRAGARFLTLVLLARWIGSLADTPPPNPPNPSPSARGLLPRSCTRVMSTIDRLHGSPFLHTIVGRDVVVRFQLLMWCRVAPKWVGKEADTDTERQTQTQRQTERLLADTQTLTPPSW